MTYPTVPIGDQWQHRTVPDRAAMHARIDVPLNAGAAVMRGFPGDNRLYVVKTGSTAQANGTTVVFDKVVADPLSAYNATTGIWTAPASGLYLMSGKLTQGNAAVAIAMTINGLDTGTYPLAAVASASTAAAAYESCDIPLFPVVAAAGDQFYVRAFASGGSGNWTPDGTATGQQRAGQWSIQYVGKFSGAPNPGTDPDVTPPMPWIDGEPVTDLKLYRRFDQPMDGLQPYLQDYGAQLVTFLGSCISQTLSQGYEIPFNVEFDTAGTWSADFNQWLAPTDGIYVVSVSVRASGDTDIGWWINGPNAPYRGINRAAGGGANRGGAMAYVLPMTAGQALSVVTDFSTPTGNTLSTYMAVTQIG